MRLMPTHVRRLNPIVPKWRNAKHVSGGIIPAIYDFFWFDSVVNEHAINGMFAPASGNLVYLDSVASFTVSKSASTAHIWLWGHGGDGEPASPGISGKGGGGGGFARVRFSLVHGQAGSLGLKKNGGHNFVAVDASHLGVHDDNGPAPPVVTGSFVLLESFYGGRGGNGVSGGGGGEYLGGGGGGASGGLGGSGTNGQDGSVDFAGAGGTAQFLGFPGGSGGSYGSDGMSGIGPGAGGGGGSYDLLTGVTGQGGVGYRSVAIISIPD